MRSFSLFNHQIRLITLRHASQPTTVHILLRVSNHGNAGYASLHHDEVQTNDQ